MSPLPTRILVYFLIACAIAPGVMKSVVHGAASNLTEFGTETAQEYGIGTPTTVARAAPAITPPAAPGAAVVVSPTTSPVVPATDGDDDGPGASIVVTIVVALGVLVFIGLRVRTRKDPKRCADRSDRARVFERWGEGCGFRWVTWRRCQGPIVMGHQKAHAHGGKTVPSNLFPECDRHNSHQSDMHSARYILKYGIPVLGWWVYLFRWFRAEVLE